MSSKALSATFSKMRKANSKFGSRKVKAKGGLVFDSKLEYERWLYLSGLEKEGKITNLRTQVRFIVIPAQYVEEPRFGVGGRPLKPRMKLVEYDCHYTADFVYELNGKEVIEDTKGFKTQDYIIRRKLMRQMGKPITEVSKPTQSIC